MAIENYRSGIFWVYTNEVFAACGRIGYEAVSRSSAMQDQIMPFFLALMMASFLSFAWSFS